MQQRLQQRLRAAHGGEGGFTLIELLIVIIILGVLAGVVVFSVGFISNRGETAACQADRKNVEVAVEAFYAQFSKYPTDIDEATHADINYLVGAKVLKSAPSSAKYAIVYTPGTHAVTGTLTAGGTC